MADIEQRRLDVEATLKADGFAVGAKQIEASSQTAGQAAVKLSDIIRKTGEAGASAAPSLSRTGDSVEKLKRSLIDGYAATQKAEQAINGISKAMAAGNLAGDELTRSIDGVIRRYGILAAESVAASKGTLQNAAAVELLNSRLRQQAAIRPAANQNIAGFGGNVASFQTANIAAQFQDIGVTAAMGMSPLQIALQQGTQLSAVLGPMGAAGAVRGLGAAFASLISPVSLITIGLIAASAAAIQYFMSADEKAKTTDQALGEHEAAIRRLKEAYGEAAEGAKLYSAENLMLVDSLARTNKATLEAQLRTESRTFIDKNTGLGPVMQTTGEMKDVALVATQALLPFSDAILRLRKEMEAGKPNFDAFYKAVNDIAGADLSGELRKVGDELITSTDNAEKFTRAIKSAQEATETIQRGQRGPLINDPAFLSKDKYQVMPGMPIPSTRPNIELEGMDEIKKTQTAYEQLSQAADKRIAQMQNEMSIVGRSTNMQARLRAEFEAEAQYREQIARDGADFSQSELDALKKKAAELAGINAQLAAQKLLTGQQDQIQQLQLEASLIGASAQERARSTAAFQAEQAMRQQGIDLMSREAEQYRANAVAIADARLEIERQSAAYAAAQQAGGQLIDQMFVGTGSIEDRLKSMANTLLTTFQQLAVANPLKNALTGTNLPTLSDLFSGRPSMPGATSTAMMTVTAGTVMLNGGLPGLSNNGGLGSLIGLSPANQNSNMELYRNAIGTIESDNRYGALGPFTKSGDRAYGRYQVMGDNIGPWTEGALGKRMSPDQFLSNPGAQDAVFDKYFGASVQKYGNPSDAASIWHSGVPLDKAAGRQDILGTTTTGYVEKFNTTLNKLSTTTTSAANDIGTLGQNSFDAGKSLTDVFGQGANTALNQFPAAPITTQTQTPSGGGNIFSTLFSSLFGLLGFADGTNYSRGGLAMVGERGPELVSLPRGSHVTPNHKLPAVNNGGSSGRMKVDVGVSVDKNGNLQAYVRNISHEVSNENTRSALASYDQNHLPGRMKQIAADPLAMG